MATLPETLPVLLAQAAEREGKRIALVQGEEIIRYRELVSMALAACRACMAAGLEPGDRAAIWAPNLSRWVVAALGLQLAGAVLVPLNTRFKGAEAAWILKRSRAKLLFTVQDFLDINYLEMLKSEELPALQGKVLLQGSVEGTQDWKQFMAEGKAVPLAEARQRMDAIRGDDILDLMFTSGTTGRPKGVLTTHSQNIRVYDTWSRTVGLEREDRYLVINPFFHSFGYKAGWFSAILRGCSVLPMKTLDVEAVLSCIETFHVTMLPGPPTLFQSLLAHPGREQYDLSSLRLAVTGAASVPVRLVERIRSDLGFDAVLTAYGLTESSGVVTICDKDDDLETIATTSGRAMPGVDIRCVDAQGETVPPGEQGELLVQGYNVMQGYFEEPEETARAIDSEGWLHTGDVAVIDEQGCVRITDRIKDMFIVGGFNCYPAEIENTLCTMEGIERVAVVGVPDERLGEVAKAFIVASGTAADLTGQQVIDWCRVRMANYKVPRFVVFVQELPVNASGKVMKNVLRGNATA